MANGEPCLLKPGLTVYQAATYQIRVQGRLGENWSDWFDGMNITVRRSPDGHPVTVLDGRVVDQAALFGLLEKLYTLGLPLLALDCLDFGEVQ